MTLKTITIMKNLKISSVIIAIALSGFIFVSNAEAEPCTVTEECTESVTLSCTDSGGDCKKEDCKFIKCSGVKIPTDTCPLCTPIIQ